MYLGPLYFLSAMFEFSYRCCTLFFSPRDTLGILEESRGLQSMAWQRVGYDSATEHAQILSLLIFQLPRWYSGKESSCQCRRCKRREFDPWVRKIPWRSKWQPTPIFFHGKFHRQRSLASTVHGVTKNQTWLSNKAQHSKIQDQCTKVNYISIYLQQMIRN